MSKTIRRKNTAYNYYWNFKDYRWFRREYTPEECIQEKAKYHSDAGFGSYNKMAAPHWYRRYLLNKREKTKEKLDILKFCKNAEHDVLKPKRVRNASWFW